MAVIVEKIHPLFLVYENGYLRIIVWLDRWRRS
jgi:hypothetical protein